MRRLPVFVCVDVSESMAGEAVEALHNGLLLLLQTLKKDPMVIEIGALSVISFGNKAKVEVPLSDVIDVRIPDFVLSSGTSLGAAFKLLASEINSKVVKTTPDVRGDYKPIIFLITDGQPTDNWQTEFAKFRKNFPSLVIHAVGCGDDVDFSILSEITPNVYVMDDMTTESFGELFKCVTASVRSVASSVNAVQEAKDDLTEWGNDNIRKPTAEECRPLGQSRQTFVAGMCSRKNRHFLIRYKANGRGSYDLADVHPLANQLEGEEMSGGNINIENLNSSGFKCPHCGNADMFYCRSCNAMVCKPQNTTHGHCPGCNWEGELVFENYDVRKNRG